MVKNEKFLSYQPVQEAWAKMFLSCADQLEERPFPFY